MIEIQYIWPEYDFGRIAYLHMRDQYDWIHATGTKKTVMGIWRIKKMK